MRSNQHLNKINKSNKSELTCKQISNMIDYMTAKHSKSLFTRLDLMNASDADTIIQRKHITRILESTKRTLNRKLKDSSNKLDMHYVWTTEQTHNAKHPHYHLFIGVNGNAIRNGYSIMAVLLQHVQKVQQTNKAGIVHFSESNGTYGVLCDRNREDFAAQKAKALANGSYLAKLYSKEHNPKWARSLLSG